ncbi:S24/S26 family peptidase [Kitasatospora sp. NPDC059811]|uniref:S24/S26 family peptidase n=1 Tax=Streptomycetaceae TaxID=2062 RepID=UPI0007AFD570|nr:S24/S26 family peptidase [Streptomyces sp. MJM8645]
MSEEPSQIRLLRSALAAVGRARLRTAGRSMLPTIEPGTVITVLARPFDEVEPGDVAVVLLDRKVIVHRVVDRAGSRLLTRGDNLPLVDPVVGPGEYLGVVPAYRRAVTLAALDLARLAAYPDRGAGRTRIWLPGPAPAYAWWHPAMRRGDMPGLSRGEARPVVSVSPYGALPGTALDELLAAAGRRDVDILIGRAAGCPSDDRTTGSSGDRATGPSEGWGGRPPLRPGTADFHVGHGTLLEPPRLADTAEFVRARVEAVRGVLPVRPDQAPGRSDLAGWRG